MTRYHHGHICGPIHISPRHMWRYLWHTRQWFGVFRNRADRRPDLPRRWGFRVLGFEFGRRG